MKTYTEKLEDFWEEMRIEIRNKVRELGADSNFTQEKTVQVTCCNNTVLGNGGTLMEIGESDIYDEDGYVYTYVELQYEELAELVDYLNDL